MGVERTSISGDWMSAFSQKRPFLSVNVQVIELGYLYRIHCPISLRFVLVIRGASKRDVAQLLEHRPQPPIPSIAR